MEMNRLFVGAAAVLAMASTARAADLPVKAPYSAPVVAAYNWTGCYVGGNVGYGWAKESGTETFAGVLPGTTSGNLTGVVGGGQIGCNWQTSSWVFGVEGDFQGTSQRAAGIIAAVPGVTFTETDSVPWFGTVRGRIGFTPVDKWLIYFTGGGGWLQDKTSLALSIVGVGTGMQSFTTTQPFWTVGAGVEWALWGNWTAKLEYLYLDTGNFNNNFTFLGVVPVTTTNRIQDNIVRTGLNFRF